MRKALFLLVIAACGDGGPSIPVEDFLAGRHAAECARLTRCGLFATEETCNAYFRRPSEAHIVAAIEADKLAYDGASAVECLTALAAIGCDKTRLDARTLPPTCAKTLRGRIADGEQCAFDGECSSGTCADIPSCTRNTCCYGTCAPSAASEIEGPCANDAQCPDGSYCHKSKVCRARVAENGACDDARGCDDGLACIGVTDLQAGTCRKLPPTGQSCPYMQCADINARCTSDFTCVALGLPGMPCANDTECSPFAQCDETAGTCVDIPTLGQPCDVYCAGEAWCNANVCSPPVENGAMCSADNECRSTDCVEGPVFDVCAGTAVCF